MSREITPRRAERRAVSMNAQCRTGSGLRDVGHILDLSANGCCIATNSLFFRVGVRVVVRPEGLEGLSGVIRWIGDGKAGVEFDVPLYGPVLEHLARLHAAGEAVAVGRY